MGLLDLGLKTCLAIFPSNTGNLKLDLLMLYKRKFITAKLITNPGRL